MKVQQQIRGKKELSKNISKHKKGGRNHESELELLFSKVAAKNLNYGSVLFFCKAV